VCLFVWYLIFRGFFSLIQTLRNRKILKHKYKLIAEKFNSKPLKSDWVRLAMDLGLLEPTPPPPPVTASPPPTAPATTEKAAAAAAAAAAAVVDVSAGVGVGSPMVAVASASSAEAQAHSSTAETSTTATATATTTSTPTPAPPPAAPAAAPVSTTPAPAAAVVEAATGIDALALARFMRRTPGLGKAQIGEYIGKGPANLFPFHAEVLREYVATFDFGGATFSSALRMFLGEFRLPGEAQCIDRYFTARPSNDFVLIFSLFLVYVSQHLCQHGVDTENPFMPRQLYLFFCGILLLSRIMEAFAGHLFAHLGEGRPFVNADAAFILAFSTILLNTDLHNPGIPQSKKMTK
jgi:hypothetical protein